MEILQGIFTIILIVFFMLIWAGVTIGPFFAIGVVIWYVVKRARTQQPVSGIRAAAAPRVKKCVYCGSRARDALQCPNCGAPIA